MIDWLAAFSLVLVVDLVLVLVRVGGEVLLVEAAPHRHPQLLHLPRVLPGLQLQLPLFPPLQLLLQGLLKTGVRYLLTKASGEKERSFLRNPEKKPSIAVKYFFVDYLPKSGKWGVRGLRSYPQIVSFITTFLTPSLPDILRNTNVWSTRRTYDRISNFSDLFCKPLIYYLSLY